MENQNSLFELELARGAKTIPATRANLMGTIYSPSHNQAIAEGRAATDKKQYEKVKSGLPGAIIHAKKIKDGKRCDANVEEESDYVGNDFDHLKEQGVVDIKEYFVKHILPVKDEIRLVWAYITYSGNGIRLVVRRPSNAGIEETQKWVAFKIKLKHDTKCKDKARLFFLPGIDDILFMNEAALFGEKELPPYTIAPLALSESEPLQAESSQVVEVEKEERFGIKLVDLVERIVTKIVKHPLPLVEGERNNTLLAAARKMLAVESDPNILASLLMPFGLGKAEVTQVVNNALKYKVEGETIHTDVRSIIRELRAEAGLITGDGLLPCRLMPKKFPLLVRELVAIAPPGFEAAVIMAALPLMGTIATRLRMKYLDGAIHSPSFMSHIIGEQAGGKSFINRLAELLLHRIRMRDEAARAQEQEYLEAVNRCKNETKQPDDPKPVIREVPFTISVSMLLKRLAQAHGEHLISVTDEVATVTKTNKAGAWSQKTEIYRHGFDNMRYGQDYLSENSYSGIYHVFYNMLSGGTPDTTEDFFRGNALNGSATRYCIATIPENFGGKMPVFKTLTAKQKAFIEQGIDLLEQAEGEIHLPKILKALEAWQEEKRQLAIETQSKAIDTFRRRSANIGFRAGALAYKLCGDKENSVVIDFTLWVADFVLQQQVAQWGAELERSEEPKQAHPVVNLYQELPEKFTREELVNLRIVNGQGKNVRMIIKRWRDSGMIQELGDKSYIKTSK